MAEDTFAERLWEGIDEALAPYDVPSEFGEILKDDLKAAFAIKAKPRPGYEPGAVRFAQFNLIDAITQPGKTAWRTISSVFENRSRPSIPLLWTDAEDTIWRRAFAAAGVDLMDRPLVPRSLEDSILRWNEGARIRELRLIREKAAIRQSPGLTLMMTQRLREYYISSGARVPVGLAPDRIISQAAEYESYIAGCLFRGDWAGATELQVGKNPLHPVTGQPISSWAAISWPYRDELQKEFERVSRVGGAGISSAAWDLANSPEAQFWRYWKNRNLYFQTLNFLNTWKEKGFWGVVGEYVWKEFTKRAFAKGTWRYWLYPKNLIGEVVGWTAERVRLIALLNKLTDAKALFARTWRRLIATPLKKGFEFVRDRIIRKAVGWLITKLGLRVLITKIGAWIGGLIGTIVAPGIGSAIAAVLGAFVSFIGGIIGEKMMKPVLTGAVYLFAGSCGCLALAIGGAAIGLPLLMASFFAPGAGGPGPPGPGPIPPAEVEVEKEVCPVDEFGQVLEAECSSRLEVANPTILPLTVEWRVYVKNNTSDPVGIMVMDERCGKSESVTAGGGERKFAFSCQESFLVGTKDITFTNATEGTAPIGVAVAWGMAILRIGTPAHTLPSGWPTSGIITQGPNVPCPSHGSMEAIDIANVVGTSVYATHSGEVVEAGWLSSSCGYGVRITATVGASTFTSQYCHLSRVDISEGNQVTDGQPIGLMGSSGTTGSHLHYSLIGLSMAPPYIPQSVCCCREDLDDDGSWEDEDTQYCGSSSSSTLRCNTTVSR